MLKQWLYQLYYGRFEEWSILFLWEVKNQIHFIGEGEGDGEDIFQGNGGNDYFFGDDGHNIAVFNGEKNNIKLPRWDKQI